MATIEVKYRVYYTEYERGWGSKPDGYRDFDNEEDALKHSEELNAKNNKPQVPDWYITASDPKLVDKNGNQL